MTGLVIEIPKAGLSPIELGSPVPGSMHCATPTPRWSPSPMCSPLQRGDQQVTHAHIPPAMRQWLLEWNLRHHGHIKENLPPQENVPPQPQSAQRQRGGLLERNW
jgi:hypothetical protein